MMRPLRRAPVIVALFLLAWAATASAECAWVLWGIDIVSKFHSPLASFTTKPQCDSEMQQLRREQPSLRWVCLPDTVDPRGPKGK